MKLRNRIISIVTCAAMLLTMLPAQVFAEEEPVTVTIFTTNDIHGTMEGDGTVGIVQAAAMKASTPNALLADAGDATQGASFATISQGEDVIRMMNAAGYDVMAAGNHEFDYGTEQLLSNAETAEFPIISANVKLNDELMLPPTAIVEQAGKTIGFIGLTTVNTLNTANPEKLAGVSFSDEAAAAKEQIKALADQTDAIVLICHLGDNEAAVKCTSKDLLDALSDSELAEVAAVIDGHSHTVEDMTYERGNVSVPVVQTGVYSSGIGKLELTFNNGKVTADGDVLTAAEASEYQLTDAGKAAAEKVQKALDDIKAEQEKTLGEELCYNRIPLWGGYIYYDYAEPRIVETSYGDFVTDAFAEYAAAFNEQNKLSLPVIAVENGGGISAALPMGKVTRGDVLNAFNHGNMVEVYTVTPAQLKTALEAGLTMTGQDETGLLIRERVSGSFLQVSGFEYTYDPSGESGNKVKEIKLEDGTALSLTDTSTKLLLATNNYVGGSFAALGCEKLGELGGEDQLISDYILSFTSVSSLLNYQVLGNRIKIYNDKAPDTYTVKIPVYLPDGKTVQPGAKANICVDGEQSQPVATDEDGNIVMTVPSGAHTFVLLESSDDMPVYTNNYSGSGTVTTKPGYYSLSFKAEELPAFDPEVEKDIDEAIQYLKEKVVEYNEWIEKNITELTDDKKEDFYKSMDRILDIAEQDLRSLGTIDKVEERKAYYDNNMQINMHNVYVRDSIEYYCKEIDALEFVSDEIKQEAKSSVANAALQYSAHVLGDVLNHVDPAETLKNIKVYDSIMYLGACEAYIEDNYLYCKGYLDLLRHHSDADINEYREKIEEMYKEAKDILANYTDAEAAANTINKYFDDSDAFIDSILMSEYTNLVNGFIPDTFDWIVTNYSEKLADISDEEVKAIRDEFIKVAEESVEPIREETQKDQPSSDNLKAIVNKVISKFDQSVLEVFYTNSKNKLSAAASDAKAALEGMEEEYNVDLSDYIADIDKALEAGIDSLNTEYQKLADENYSISLIEEEDAPFDVSDEAIAEAYDRLNSAITSAQEQIYTVLDSAADESESEPESQPESQPESEPESQPDSTPESQPESEPESQPESQPDENPDTGYPIGGAVIVTLILSGCAAAAMPISRKLRREKNDK